MLSPMLLATLTASDFTVLTQIINKSLKMTDVPCDPNLDLCEVEVEETPADPIIELMLRQHQLFEYALASKSLIVMLFSSQLVSEYPISAMEGPYGWWAITGAAMMLSSFFQLLGFGDYYLSRNARGYGMWFRI